LPVGFPAHAMSGSNQLVSEPRPFRAFAIVMNQWRIDVSRYSGQFRVLEVGLLGLLIHPSYHAGFTR
jgi:hypothetical protein